MYGFDIMYGMPSSTAYVIRYEIAICTINIKHQLMFCFLSPNICYDSVSFSINFVFAWKNKNKKEF